MKLVKTKNIAPQLSNQEWIHSVPGTRDEKRILSRCVNCHSIERVVTSKHTAPELVAVMERMATYSNNSFFMKPQVRAMARDMERFAPNATKDAAYLASINLSTGERKWDPKALPRVTGRGTRVIITEYDLPRPETQPHDVIVDKEGVVWYSDFSDQFLGRFDPKTLAIKEYPVPLHRDGFPTGALDLEVDPDGNLWLALMFQAGIAKFDKKTEKMQTWQLPEGVLKEDSQQAMVGPQNWTVDGKVWMTDPSLPGLYRMDMKTGQTEKWEPYKNLPKAPHSVYGIYSDKENNIWFLDFGGENVGFIDAKTKRDASSIRCRHLSSSLDATTISPGVRAAISFAGSLGDSPAPPIRCPLRIPSAANCASLIGPAVKTCPNGKGITLTSGSSPFSRPPK